MAGLARHEANHTSDVGLETATDRAIRRHANSIGATIVTKDEDFVLLKTADPTGPSVVWIRVGNAVRRVLFQRFITAWPAVVAKLASGEAVVEVR